MDNLEELNGFVATGVIDNICRKIRSCDRLMDNKTKFCVCCSKCYDIYYFKNTHKQSIKHLRNYNRLIKFLCSSGDDRVPDIILYMIDN
jgi:hypothetical protein